MEECAEAMGLSTDEMASMEFGERPPTLPELEILAYYLDLPPEHFWESKILQIDASDKMVDTKEIKQLRQNAIGALIRKARVESALSIEDLAEKAGVEPAKLQSIELGDIPIPLPDLEILAQVLSNPIVNFEDQQSQVGDWFMEKRNVREFLNLPRELQEFVGKPINKPYLELAVRLSELKVEKLRSLAEGLLEITL
jgi:transcriptional regulator with XRE-family HTH domain